MATFDDPMLGWTGRILGGRYRLEQVIGQGGFGVVFRGRHLVLDAPVAVKVMRAARVDGTMRERLVTATVREAQLLARLRHPAIVAVLDGGYEEDPALGVVPWFAMEWCEGETLEADLTRRRGRGGRSVAEALALLRPVLEGVAHGHAQGIAHRDLKPANIILVRTPQGVAARVLDFGLAKKLGDDEHLPLSGATATASSDRAYTPGYAAPEQIAGGRTGPWTDVHALGLVVSEMLMDRPAYDPDTFYLSAIDAVRPTPRKYGVDAGAWEAPLARALALHPGERFPSAGAMLEQLVASSVAPAQHATVGAESGGWNAAASAPARAGGGGAGPTAAPAPRSSALSIVAIAVGALALVGVAGLGWMSWSDAPEAAPAKSATSSGAALRAITADDVKRLVLARNYWITNAQPLSAATYEMTIFSVSNGTTSGGVTFYKMAPSVSHHAIVEAASKSPGVALAHDAQVLLQVGLYGATGQPALAEGKALLGHILAAYPGTVIATPPPR